MKNKYTFQFFSGEENLIPKMGDKFIVTELVTDVLDFHWGRCTIVMLEPEKKEENSPLETKSGQTSRDSFEEWIKKTKDNEWWMTHDEFMKNHDKEGIA
jgi:hypothetical protein